MTNMEAEWRALAVAPGILVGQRGRECLESGEARHVSRFRQHLSAMQRYSHSPSWAFTCVLGVVAHGCNIQHKGTFFSVVYFSRGTLPQQGKRALLGDLAYLAALDLAASTSQHIRFFGLVCLCLKLPEIQARFGVPRGLFEYRSCSNLGGQKTPPLTAGGVRPHQQYW